VSRDVGHAPAEARSTESSALAEEAHDDRVAAATAREVSEAVFEDPQRRYASNSSMTNSGKPPACSARSRKLGQCSATTW
jgi:hypothetical protein